VELARNLKVESVSRLRPAPPYCMAPEQTVAAAVALMREVQIGCLLVCRRGALVGLFTERDLMRRVLAAGKPLSLPLMACMTVDPIVVGLRDPVRLAVRRMVEGGYRHLPVVDEAQRPVGVLSVKRIVHFLVEHFPATVYNQPPDPDVYPATPGGA
jgi:CBS domain-containing protein